MVRNALDNFVRIEMLKCLFFLLRNRILDSENYSQADAIVIAYPSLLLVVTVAGDSNMYGYDSIPFLIPEMDCVRILSNTEHEMLQKVPSCVNNIFAINSQKPSSYLFGAYQKYEVSECNHSAFSSVATNVWYYFV